MARVDFTDMGVPIGVPISWRSFHPDSQCLVIAYGKVTMNGVCLNIYWRSLVKGKYEPLSAPAGYQFFNAPIVSQSNAGAYIMLRNLTTDDTSLGKVHFPDGRVSHCATLEQPAHWARCWLASLYGVGGEEYEIYARIGTEPRMSDPKAFRHMTYRVALLRADTGRVVEIGPLATPFC